MTWDRPPPPPEQPDGWQQGSGWGRPGGWRSYPEASQSQTVFILGILGLVLCGILAPIAWVMGNTEITAIQAGRRPPEGLSQAKTGRTLGMIGTILGAIGIGIVVVLLIAAAATNPYSRW